MAAMASPNSYHLLTHAHRRWRRYSHTPIWGDLLANTTWWMVLFLVVIPLALVLGMLVVRTHTTHYLLTGPPGSTADHLGPGIVEVLNTPTKLERLLHLNIVPDPVVKESCGRSSRAGSRVQRIYHAVERAARAAGIFIQGRGGNVTRYQTYLRPIRAKTMSLLRQRTEWLPLGKGRVQPIPQRWEPPCIC